MTALDDPIITFTHEPSGREVARIGRNVVGYVMPYVGGKTVVALSRCLLFDNEIQPKPAQSYDRAKVNLLRRIADWHDLSGGPYRDLADRIREQAAQIDAAAREARAS